MTEQDNILLVQKQLSGEFNIVPTLTFEEWLMQLAAAVNHLIQKDFSGLVHILYRLDVSEARLKGVLQEQAGKDAGELIATMMVERQLEKMRMRSQFRNPNNIPDDEKW